MVVVRVTEVLTSVVDGKVVVVVVVVEQSILVTVAGTTVVYVDVKVSRKLKLKRVVTYSVVTVRSVSVAVTVYVMDDSVCKETTMVETATSEVLVNTTTGELVVRVVKTGTVLVSSIVCVVIVVAVQMEMTEVGEKKVTVVVPNGYTDCVTGISVVVVTVREMVNVEMINVVEVGNTAVYEVDKAGNVVTGRSGS